jgi:hypothetical protein
MRKAHGLQPVGLTKRRPMRNEIRSVTAAVATVLASLPW